MRMWLLSDPPARRRRDRMVLWVAFSSALAIRDLWLDAHGGGVTPRWLLRGEATAFGLSAACGLAVLTSTPTATNKIRAATPVTVVASLGVTAVAMHLVRFAVYLRTRDARVLSFKRPVEGGDNKLPPTLSQ